MARGLRSKRLKKLKKLRAVKLDEEWERRKEEEKTQPKAFSFKASLFPAESMNTELPGAVEEALAKLEEKREQVAAGGHGEDAHADGLQNIDSTVRSHRFLRRSKKKGKTNMDRHRMIFKRVKVRQERRQKGGKVRSIPVATGQPEQMQIK